MLNFTIKTPPEVVFGRGIEEKIGERIKEYGAHRVLVHFGGASARSSGLLDRVEHSLFDAGLCQLLAVVGGAVVHIVQNGGARDGDGAGGVIVHLLGAAAGQSQQQQHR